MTATAARTQVQMARGFSTIVINLDEVAGGFEVSAARFYRTHQGARVGGTTTKTFTNRDKARAYANGYVAHMAKKGWTRVA